MDLAIIALLILAFAGRGSGDETSDEQPTTTPPGTPELSPGGGTQLSRAQVEQIAAELGLDAQWGRFLAAVAAGESDFVTDAIGTQDAGAARAAWNRNAERYADCGIDPERYQVGSVGLYQILPANGLAPWWGTPYACMDPIEALSHPDVATIAAVEYARRSMRWSDWQRSDKTWGALRRAWRSPSLSDADRPDIDERFQKQLKRIGIPTSFASEKVTPLPGGFDPVALVAMFVELQEVPGA